MGQLCSRSDFEWSYTEEPHATRRKEILAKYPKIEQLMGPDPALKWQVLILVTIQLITLPLVSHMSLPVFLLSAYCIGGVINHALNLAIHELSHNLAFGYSKPLWNRALGMIANLPIGVPSSVTFKKYHLLHHRYQGDRVQDVDIPTDMEAQIFRTTGLKLVWLFLQPLCYAVRPLIVLPLPITPLEIINIIVQVTFDSIVFTLWGWKALAYLITGTLLAMGVHPVAGHFISEHFTADAKFETSSYYGILNLVTFNVGYHVEHHDFPYIPGSRLPMLRKIAPEYYNNLPSHDSWVKVLYDFVMRPDMGLFSRVCREQSGKSAVAAGAGENLSEAVESNGKLKK